MIHRKVVRKEVDVSISETMISYEDGVHGVKHLIGHYHKR